MFQTTKYVLFFMVIVFMSAMTPMAWAQDQLSDFGITEAPEGAQPGDQVQGGANQDLVVVGDPHAGGSDSGSTNTGGRTPPQHGGLVGHPGLPDADTLMEDYGGFGNLGRSTSDPNAQPQLPGSEDFDNTHDSELGDLWRQFNRGDITRDEYVNRAQAIMNPDDDDEGDGEGEDEDEDYDDDDDADEDDEDEDDEDEDEDDRVGMNDDEFGDDVDSAFASSGSVGRDIHVGGGDHGRGPRGRYHDRDD